MFATLPAPAPVYKAGAKPAAWRAIRRVADKQRSAAADAFLGAVHGMREACDLDGLAEALESGRIEPALRIADPLGMQAALLPLIAILNECFLQGSAAAGSQLVDLLQIGHRTKRAEPADILKAGQARYALRFDLVNPDAVKWANQNAGRLITQIGDQTREGIQAIIVRGQKDGIAPRELAKLIRDQGIGLNRPQALALMNYRDGLKAAGLSPAKQQQLIERKVERDIKYRSLMIARHELLQAANEGQRRIWAASADAGLIPETTKRKWIITPDDRLCPLCSQMTGERAITGLKQPWQTPRGPVSNPQQIHVMCRCAQGLVIDLDAARAQAEEAIAEPSIELQAIMPALSAVMSRLLEE